MPGARELRELCQALQISPNKLLFGSEVPFKEQSFMDTVLDAEPEDEQVARVRAAVLLGLLASDERRAVVTLIRSLALARHGEAKVKEVMMAADVNVGVIRGLAKLTSEGIKTGKPLSPEQITNSADEFEKFMDRNGHIEDPRKLPKK